MEPLTYSHGWDFSGSGQISGFKYLSESNNNGAEMHFECEFSPFMTPVFMLYFLISSYQIGLYTASIQAHSHVAVVNKF